jgi:hypothetical protein
MNRADPFRPVGDTGKPVSDWLLRLLKDVAAHPFSSAQEIAVRLDVQDARLIFKSLDNAAYSGLCQRSREGANDPWRWEVPPGVFPEAG